MDDINKEVVEDVGKVEDGRGSEGIESTDQLSTIQHRDHTYIKYFQTHHCFRLSLALSRVLAEDASKRFGGSDSIHPTRS